MTSGSIRVISPGLSDEDSDPPSAEDDAVEEEAGGDQEEELTPQEIYARAKENIHFQKDEALEFFNILVDIEDSPDDKQLIKIKAKSASHAAILLSEKDPNIDRVAELFLRASHYFDIDVLSQKKLKKTSSSILLNLVTNDEAAIEFLSKVAMKMNQTKGLSIHLDMCLRLAELHLKYGHYTEAQELITETERLIPIPPDPKDNFLVQSSLNFLIMKIDVLIFRQNFKDAEKAFDQFNQVAVKLKLPTDKRIDMLSTANWATLLFARGLNALESRNFLIAKKNFFESFKQYEACGDKKITNPIPYYWLGSLLSRDVADVSQMPEFRAYLGHPYVAPMKKLCDSYSFQNVQDVKELKVGYDNIFCTAVRPTYKQFFDTIIEYCVESAIIIESKAFSRVTFSYLSEKIKYNIQQIERISANLIANRRLSGLIDDEQKALIMVQSPLASNSFLESISSILPTLENLCSLNLD